MKNLYISFLLLFCAIQLANAQAPSNNDCGGATSLAVNSTITCSTTTTGTTVGATQSSSGCTGTADDDVWYSFVATATSHIITVTPGSLKNPVLQVYRGSCGSLTSLDCRNASTGTSTPESSTLTSLTIGNTYYARVHSFANSSGSRGTFTMCVATPSPPLCTSNINPTNGATNVSLTPTLSWNSSSGAATYDLYYGPTNPPVIFAGNYSATSVVMPSLSPNLYYWYLVPKNSYGDAIGCNSTTTSFTTLNPPANDNCSGAITLTVNPTSTMTTTTSFNTDYASQSQLGCTGTADDDVWFKFVATASTHNFSVSSSTSADLVHEVFSGTCGGVMASMICSDPNTSSGSCFVAGTTYYIRVYTNNNLTASGTVTLGVGTPSAVVDATAETSSQICAPYVFTAGVNQPSGGGGCGVDYGCVFTQPNPEYHWIEVATAGNIRWNIDNSAGVDVDYVVWGPFSTPPNPNSLSCSLLGLMPTITGSALGTPFVNAGVSTTTIAPHGCDYSTDRGGNVNIDAVLAGQYYLLLVTNYANVATTITISELSTNTANIACPCLISDITATPSACAGVSNYYSTTGTLTYNNAPNSGTLSITDNNGRSVSYSYPFPASPISYTIAGNTSDAAVHNIVAQFSTAPQCNRCISYTAPAPCCTVPVGSVTNISDNSCGYTFDLTASSGGGGPYEWSTDTLFSSILTSFSGLYLPLPSSSFVYYVRKVGQTCAASVYVSDPTPSTYLTTGSCQTCTVGEAATRTFYDASNDIIATLQDAAGGTNLGVTTACAYVDAGAQAVGGQHYMQRHFDFEVTNNGPADVTLYLTEADVNDLISASAGDGPTFGVFTSMADLCIMQYDGLAETPQSHTTQHIIEHSDLTIEGPTDGNYKVTFHVTGFSGFYCYACNPMGFALPVEWLNFNGYHNGESNILNWNTLTEVNNDHFEVERSIDGIKWNHIGANVAGAVNSTTINKYTFTDNQLENSMYYYRIKQVDKDAKYSYSNIIQIQTEAVNVNNIFPNPASDKIYYSLSTNAEQNVEINILNMNGQIISTNHHTIAKGNNNLKESVVDLPAGVYMLKVTELVTGNSTMNKFIKN